MKDRYFYPAIFNYAEDGISVSFPDLPGCLTCAHDTETAVSRAEEALGLYLFDCEECGDVIPEPSDFRSWTLEKGDMPVMVNVFMPVIRERAKKRTMKKTLTIPSWLNIQAEQAGINFSQVLQEGLKQRLNVT